MHMFPLKKIHGMGAPAMVVPTCARWDGHTHFSKSSPVCTLGQSQTGHLRVASCCAHSKWKICLHAWRQHYCLVPAVGTGPIRRGHPAQFARCQEVCQSGLTTNLQGSRYAIVSVECLLNIAWHINGSKKKS